MSAAAARWQAEGRRLDLLLSEGKSLTEAEALAAAMGPALLEAERALIEASRRKSRRRVRLKRAATASLIILAVAASLAAAIARWESAKADRNAKIASENEQKARAQASIATSRQLAALSATERDTRLDLSLILAVEALQTENTFEARNSLLSALQARPELRSFLHVPEGSVVSVAFSPDGKTIAAGYAVDNPDNPGGASGVVLWDAAGRKRLVAAPLAVKEGSVRSVAFSPDGKTIAAGYGGGKGGGVVLWDVASRKRLGEPRSP